MNPEAIESISKRLQYALKLRGWSQLQFSEKTGISTTAISQYVTGKFEPKPKPLYLMSQALDVNIVWLMGLDVPMGSAAKYNGDMDRFSSDTMEVAKAYQGANSAVKKGVWRFLGLPENLFNKEPKIKSQAKPTLKPKLDNELTETEQECELKDEPVDEHEKFRKEETEPETVKLYPAAFGGTDEVLEVSVEMLDEMRKSIEILHSLQKSINEKEKRENEKKKRFGIF